MRFNIFVVFAKFHVWSWGQVCFDLPHPLFSLATGYDVFFSDSLWMWIQSDMNYMA